MKRVLACLFFLSALVAPSVSSADHHLMKVVEVFAGSTLQPNAQYVVLQMYIGGQNVLNGHVIHVFNAAGTEVGTYTFTANVPNGATQARILIATAEAATLFDVTADLTVTASIPRAGGRLCFEAIDCVSWGSNAVAGTAGTPASRRLGIRPGEALIRRLDVSGGPTTLENADDTNDSANDFVVGAPTPRNNAGQMGMVPASTCGNDVVEGLEQCDVGSGCTDCKEEVCGDGMVNGNGIVAEECDDGNVVETDDCTTSCVDAECGDGFVHAGVEECDDMNEVSTDACVSCENATCGDSHVRAGVENCDDGPDNGITGSCNATCTGETGTVCGNGTPENGETCDTGGASPTCDADCSAVSCGDGTTNVPAGETCDDGASNGMPNACSATCMGETAAVCGNDVVEDGETCDDGADNGTPNACNATCTGTTTPVCGNMVPEAGEDCDLGSANGTADAHCSATCTPVEHDHGDGGTGGGGGGCAAANGSDAGVFGVVAIAIGLVLRRRRARR